MADKNLDHLDKRGYYHFGLYEFLNEYVTNWNAFLTKVDTDTGDTTFNTDHAVTSPSIGSTFGSDIQPTAIPEGKLVTLVEALRDEFNDAMDAFSADDGIDGTTIFTDEKFSLTTVADLIDIQSALVKDNGINQGALVTLLDNLLNKFETVLAACDSDATLDDTDYFSTYNIEDVIEDSSSSSSSRSSSSSSSSQSSSSSSSSQSSSSSSSSRSSSSSSSSSSRSSSSSSSSSSSLSLSSSSSSSSSSSRSSSSSSSSSRSSSSSSSSRSSSSSSSSSSSQSVG